MKKKILLAVLLFSSSIYSINADFKQIVSGKFSSQSQKKKVSNVKHSSLSPMLSLRQNKKVTSKSQFERSNLFTLIKANLNQKSPKNLNFLSPLFYKLRKNSVINNSSSKSFSFMNIFNKTSKSLPSTNSTFIISNNTPISETLKAINSPEIVTANDAKNLLSSDTPTNPNLFETFVDSSTLNSSSVDLIKDNTLISKTLPSLLQTVDSVDVTITDSVVDDDLDNPASNYLIYKGDKETLKPHITPKNLNFLKEIKEHFAKRQSSNIAKNTITDINQVHQQLKNTVTGSLLDHDRPANKTLEDALGYKVSKMLSNIAKDENKKNKIASPSIIQALKNDHSGMKKEITDLCREVLIKSAEYTDDYYTFYHGYGNGLRLYFDILREIKSFETIRNLDSSNPLRDKSTQSTDNTVERILSNFEDKALDYAARNNQQLYDLNRGMGVGFAPDKIEYFRDHVISVNPNLFGNMNNLAECTLFYWLDSFNISNPNEALVKNILTRIATHLPEDKVKERMTQYTELYNDFMKQTGGNLMQIHVHKSIVDEISYASWMKGIPVLLDKNTHKLATRGSNGKPVPVLTDRNNQYDRPKTSDYLDLLTNDPDKFIDKYSDFSNGKVVKKRDLEECLDRPQARIIVNPNYFNDPDLVKIDNYTRFKASDQALTDYQQKLKNLIQEDMNAYLKQLQKGQTKGPEGDRLTKLTKFIEEGTEFNFNSEQIKAAQISRSKEEE